MISTTDKQLTDPLERFYKEYFAFSYSSLNKLLHSAISFYNWYILKEREDSLASYLIEGKAIHCLLLERKLFDKQFITTPGKLPGVSNKKIVEDMYKLWLEQGDEALKLIDYKSAMLTWCVTNDLHQKLTDDKDPKKAGFRTGDEKRMDKLMTDESKDYFEYLKLSKDKDVITQEAYDRCLKAVDIIKENKTVTNLLKIGQGHELLEVFNEQKLMCALEKYPFGLKGIVDNYVIDHVNKKVYINDLKTTGKTLNEFKDTVEYYKYWMQGAIYTRLVKGQHPKIVDYEFILHFVVIDKYNQVYPFPVSVESMLDWQSQLDEVLEIAKYHYTNKDYTLPYEFAMDQVTL
jgi:hypothetical protein